MSKQQVQLKEKELCIDDLKNSDHIGISFNDNTKGHIVYSRYRFIVVSDTKYHTDENGNYGCGGETLIDAITNTDLCVCKKNGYLPFRHPKRTLPMVSGGVGI